MKVTRKDFLVGLGGAAVGVPLGIGAGRRVYPVSAPTPPPLAAAPEPQGLLSFSQCGEDVVADFIFQYLKVEDVTYLDVGAYDPVVLNNTYFFYRKGHRGVLVEPNLVMCEKLRAARPGDTILEAGIGIAAVREADYYLMTEPSWNTFSREEAEKMAASTNGRVAIQRVVKMPLLDINDVMAEHFKGAPAFVSIDAEGLHLPILKAIDYRRFRPKIVCIETLVAGENDVLAGIPSFMTSEGYVDRGGSFVNTIFVDSRIL